MNVCLLRVLSSRSKRNHGTGRRASLVLAAVATAACGSNSTSSSIDGKAIDPDASSGRDAALEAGLGPDTRDAKGIDAAADTGPGVDVGSQALDASGLDGGGGICQVVAAGLDGGWQLAKFVKNNVTGRSGVIELTMSDWQCRTAATAWVQKDTTAACVDGSGATHPLFLRSASFDPICGNQNSCAWLRLSETQDMPAFTGSNKGVNGYWDTANYDGRPQIFQVGIIDAYLDDLFTGSERAQDLYLSRSFTICIQYTSGSVADASISNPSDGSMMDASIDVVHDAPVSIADGPSDAIPDMPKADRSPDIGPDALLCPTYTATVGYCAGENDCAAGGGACACKGGSFCCIPGFCWTRYIAGCTQETCPPGAGRNYTNHCTCPANTKEVYDPCRPGFVVSCNPI